MHLIRTAGALLGVRDDDAIVIDEDVERCVPLGQVPVTEERTGESHEVEAAVEHVHPPVVEIGRE